MGNTVPTPEATGTIVGLAIGVPLCIGCFMFCGWWVFNLKKRQSLRREDRVRRIETVYHVNPGGGRGASRPGSAAGAPRTQTASGFMSFDQMSVAARRSALADRHRVGATTRFNRLDSLTEIVDTNARRSQRRYKPNGTTVI